MNYTFFTALVFCAVFSINADMCNFQKGVNAIGKQDIVTLHEVVKLPLTYTEKNTLVQLAADKAAQNQNTRTFSEENQKAVSATLCVALIALGGFMLEEPYKHVMASFWCNVPVDMNYLHSRAHYIIGGLTAAGAGIFSGSECYNSGYFTNKPAYIRSYLAEEFKMGYTVRF